MKAKLTKPKNDISLKIQNIINHLNFLNLGDIDENLQHIINGNISHFITDTNMPSTLKLIGEVGFIAEKNGDRFAIEFEPSLINPEFISIKHTALDGQWKDVYDVTFVPDNTDTISIVSRKVSRGTVTISKRKETTYINGQKRYEQQYIHRIGNMDDSYSESRTTCYSSLDNSYVTEVMSVGEPAALIQTSRVFIGGTPDDIKPITSEEFASKLDSFKKEKSKVFVIRKNDDI